MGKDYEHLTLDERCEIYRLRADGKSQAEVARRLGRSPSTISRELARNSGSKVGYSVSWAETQVRARRRRRLYKLECSSTLREIVLDRLAMGWSPEQIVGRLEREHGRRLISHESIYRWIYWRVGHKDYVHKLLPRKKFRRGFRGRKGGSTIDYIPDRVSIADRPEIVERRRQHGHWEADLMHFGRSGPCLLVAHERVTRLVLIRRLAGKAAAPLAATLTAMLASLKPAKRRSITFDNGVEFRDHGTAATDLSARTYFCDPRSPWQKGGVENSISRLRRRLSRKTKLADVPQEQLDQIILDYNLVPRKCLKYKSPLEAFLGTELDLSVALEM